MRQRFYLVFPILSRVRMISLLLAMLAAASLVRVSYVFDNVVHSTAAVRDNLRSLVGARCKAYVFVAGNSEFAVPG
jgi:hypothetical protein